jgi:RimJ/RimL family protein N-acetyltransferase
MNVKDFFGDLPTLRTKRLVLRKLSLDDARDMFAYASNPQMTRFTTWDAHRSIDDSRAFLAQALNKYENGQAMDWGIVDAATNQVIGTCGLTNFSEQHQRGDLGYGIAVHDRSGARRDRLRIPHVADESPAKLLQRAQHRLGTRDGKARHDSRGHVPAVLPLSRSAARCEVVFTATKRVGCAAAGCAYHVTDGWSATKHLGDGECAER